MSPRVTVGLLAVLLALGGYVYFGGSGSSQTTQPGAKTKDSADQQLEVFKLDDRDVNQIVARRGDQQTTVQKDADGNWLLHPSGQAADKLRISGLTLRLASLRASRRLGDSGNPAEFGLADPALSLLMGTSGGGQYTLLMGSKAAAEAGTYAKRADDPSIFVISNALAQDVEKLINEPPVAPPTPTPSPQPSATSEPTATPAP